MLKVEVPPEILEAERKLRGQLRDIRKLTGRDARGAGIATGGWNKKSIDEHLRDGTYRADRHGPLTPGTLGLKKPPGKIVATVSSQSQWIRNASDEHAVRNGCRFNERLADYVADFFRKYLCHSKGQWAGQPFELTDWQRREIIDPLFGWVRPDGLRRFRRSYIELPKKTGKSSIASGIGLYMLVADEEAGAEVWSTGADRDQARVVHNEAVNMVEGSPELAAILKVNHTNFNIAYHATRSYYRAVSASPRGKHGPSLHCVIADELHEWYGDELWNSMRYAFRARTQPLFFAITNAGNDLQSVCYRQREKAEAILSGAIVDDDFFAMIYAVPREEAEAEIEAVKGGTTELPVAHKCNPTLGYITTEADLLHDIRDAIHTPSELPNLLRLTYGIWNTGVSPWLQSTDWTGCGEKFTEEDLALAPCGAGLDMSKTGDMTALALVFPDQEEADLYRQLVWFWLPEKTIADRQHLIDYGAWVKGGHLRSIPGSVIDYAIIRRDIAEIFGWFSVRRFWFDDRYAGETAQWIQEEFPEIEVVEFPQTMMQFAGPTAEYERLVISGRLRHNRNPLLTWQAGHCMVKVDANNNKRPVKPKHGDIRSIDGIVGGIMALRGEMSGPPEPSAYEDHGVLYANEIGYDEQLAEELVYDEA